MANLLISGVAVIDFIFRLDALPREAEKYRADDAMMVLGGCAANAAIATERLGGKAWLASRLGADAAGELILGGLLREGVNCDLVKRYDGRRSSYSSVYVDARAERQIVNFRDPELTDDAQWISSSLPADIDGALADTRWPQAAAELMTLARARGIPAVLDAEPPFQSVKPAFEAATHIAFSAAGLGALTGHDGHAEGLARARQITGAWCCVTDGEAGVHYLDPEGVLRQVPAFKVSVVDTLGAGDVWHGAFCLRLAEGLDEVSAMRFANAAAALKCQHFGGGAMAPDRAQVQDLLKEQSE